MRMKPLKIFLDCARLSYLSDRPSQPKIIIQISLFYAINDIPLAFKDICFLLKNLKYLEQHWTEQK